MSVPVKNMKRVPRVRKAEMALTTALKNGYTMK